MNQDEAGQRLQELARGASNRGESRATAEVNGLLVTVHLSTDDKAAQFARLIAVMDASFAVNYLDPTTLPEGLDEIGEAVDMLAENVASQDGAEEMIQNLATLMGAATRMAKVVMADLTAEQLAKLIKENTP